MLVARLTRSGSFSDLRRLALLLFASFILATAAHAQTGIYVEYGGSKVAAPSNDWIYGPTFGLYHDFYSVPLVHVGADLRGSVLGVSQTTTLTSGMIGPRVSVHPHVLPAMPYLEALGGIGHYDYGAGQGSNTQFEYQFLAGIDITVLPRLDWRAVEFSYGGLSALNGTLHPRTLSMGLVLRLP
ncbi:MAG TPA: hypothetical protein VF018_07960 [Acidobacteriaceae bacterium]